MGSDVSSLASSRVAQLRAEGKQYSSVGDWVKAQESLDAACLLAPKDPNSYVLLGTLYMQQKEYGLAVTAFTEALKCDPNCQDALVHKAIIFYYLFRFSEAEEFVNKAISLDKNDAQALYIHGMIMLKINQGKRAEKSFKTILEWNPGSKQIWPLLAEAQFRIKSPEAAKSFRQAAAGMLTQVNLSHE